MIFKPFVYFGACCKKAWNTLLTCSYLDNACASNFRNKSLLAHFDVEEKVGKILFLIFAENKVWAFYRLIFFKWKLQIMYDWGNVPMIELSLFSTHWTFVSLLHHSLHDIMAIFPSKSTQIMLLVRGKAFFAFGPPPFKLLTLVFSHLLRIKFQSFFYSAQYCLRVCTVIKKIRLLDILQKFTGATTVQLRIKIIILKVLEPWKWHFLSKTDHSEQKLFSAKSWFILRKSEKSDILQKHCERRNFFAMVFLESIIKEFSTKAHFSMKGSKVLMKVWYATFRVFGVP